MSDNELNPLSDDENIIENSDNEDELQSQPDDGEGENESEIDDIIDTESLFGDNSDDDDGDDDDEMDDDFDDDISQRKNIKKSKGTSNSQAIPENAFYDNDEEIEDSEESDNDDEQSISGNITEDDDYDDNDDEDPESYFQKFDAELNQNLLMINHPTQFNKNADEIATLCNLARDNKNNVVDPLHKTIPYLTKYEKARVLGQRAKQINSGSKPYVQVPDNIIDGYIIAQMELTQKRIPFIIERPIHGGGCEYWKLRDLEIL
jgi:DNA-directed RNA polymerase subunit K/omega